MEGNFGGGKIWQISVWNAPHASRVTCIFTYTYSVDYQAVHAMKV